MIKLRKNSKLKDIHEQFYFSSKSGGQKYVSSLFDFPKFIRFSSEGWKKKKAKGKMSFGDIMYRLDTYEGTLLDYNQDFFILKHFDIYRFQNEEEYERYRLLVTV